MAWPKKKRKEEHSEKGNRCLWLRNWLFLKIPYSFLFGLYHLLLGLLNFHLKQASGWRRVCRITYEKFLRVGSPVDRPTGEDLHTGGVLRSSLSNSWTESKSVREKANCNAVAKTPHLIYGKPARTVHLSNPNLHCQPKCSNGTEFTLPP